MSEEIDMWVGYMKKHPTTWKQIHTAYINSYFEAHERFIKKMLKRPDGKEIIASIYGITNKKGYENLLR